MSALSNVKERGPEGTGGGRGDGMRSAGNERGSDIGGGSISSGPGVDSEYGSSTGSSNVGRPVW